MSIGLKALTLQQPVGRDVMWWTVGKGSGGPGRTCVCACVCLVGVDGGGYVGERQRENKFADEDSTEKPSRPGKPSKEAVDDVPRDSKWQLCHSGKDELYQAPTGCQALH